MNKIVVQIAKISWSKVFLFGLIAGGLYWIVGFNDGKDLQTELANTKQQLIEAQKQLAATKEAVASADNFEREVKDTVDQFNRVVPELMPDKMSTADLMTIASDVSNKSGVKLVKTEPRPGVDKTDFYDTTRIAISLEGNFSQIVMFLSNLSRIPKLMTFDHVDVGYAEGNTDLESPRLILNGIMVGYKYLKRGTEKKDAAAKVKPGDANEKH